MKSSIFTIALFLIASLSFTTQYNDTQELIEKAISSKEMKEKIKILNQAIEMKSNDPLLHFLLAEALDKEGDFEESLKNLNKSIALKSDYYDAYSLRAFVKQKLSDYEGQKEDLLKAIEIKPDGFWPYYSFGVFYERLQEYEKSRSYYNQSLKFKPMYEPALDGRKRVLNMINQYEWYESFKIQSKRYDGILEKMIDQQQRFDAILKTWEGQQKQFQKYLDSLEIEK